MYTGKERVLMAFAREKADRLPVFDVVNKPDMYENLLYQKVNTMEAAKRCNRILFVDTDALTTLFYSKFLLGDDENTMDVCTKMAESINATNVWDLVLFLEPEGTEFVQDGTRNETIKAQREKFSNDIKRILDKYGIEYETINGDYLNRFDTAKKIIEKKFKLTTKW